MTGPAGEDLDVTVTDSRIGKVEFPPDLQDFPLPHLRVFEFTALGAGSTTIEATVPGGGAYAAPLRVTVGSRGGAPSGLFFYYHGTTVAEAKEMMGEDLEPYLVSELNLLDVNEYTDFGKGLYTHPEESKKKAVEWAKRRAKQKCTDWGVVRFALTLTEIANISGQRLHFPDKFKTRPSNAPKLFNNKPAKWIEFVEYNRHIRTTSILRPKDNDWTADYEAWMRGPIWGAGTATCQVHPAFLSTITKSTGASKVWQLSTHLRRRSAGFCFLSVTKVRCKAFTKLEEGILTALGDLRANRLRLYCTSRPEV